jgi:hypothetical protein
MSLKVQRFITANARSPVVYGSVTGPEGAPDGCLYRLRDGATFTLTSAECRAVEPRWAFDGVPA